jgi:acetolactate synthase-1/2/3 large subunit
VGTNAEAIASVLKQSGIEYSFGLPGGEVVALIDACCRAGIRFYLTGHEASAAFMAEVTGQLTGRPGVCVSTLGPGAMNLVLGLADARLDRGPVLALTAQVSTAVERHHTHQRLPLNAIFSQICKASATVDGHGTEELAASCVRLATAPPPGPVHLALPSNLATQETAAGARATTAAKKTNAGAAPIEGRSNHVLEEIAAAFAGARQPLVVAGVGCLPADAPALRRFIDSTGVPFVVTPKVKGYLPEDAPGFLGVVSGMAIDEVMIETLDGADLLLGIGFDPVECATAWYVGRSVANLCRYPTNEGDYAPLEAIGEVGADLERLRTRVTPKPWPAAIIAERRAAVRPAPLPATDGLSPLETVRALRDVFPREAVATCDVGSHKYFMGQFWESYEPQTFFMSNGLSAMGYGLPAAIAAKLRFPHRPVVSVVGDGGMLMMMHNLVFMRQYHVPVVIVCLVDGSLSLIRLAQERRGLQPYGVDFPAPDFVAIAAGYGVEGARVSSLDELKRTAERALRSRAPFVVEVPVDIGEYRAFC